MVGEDSAPLADVSSGDPDAPIDVVQVPVGPGVDAPVPFPRAGAGAGIVEDAAMVSNDPFGVGTGGVQANPALNDPFGGADTGTPGPFDDAHLGGAFDHDDDGDTDLDDVEDGFDDLQDDFEDDAEDIVEDFVATADSNDDGTLDEDDAEDWIEDNTGIDVDLNPFD